LIKINFHFSILDPNPHLGEQYQSGSGSVIFFKLFFFTFFLSI
jgi:hypothetical protein